MGDLFEHGILARGTAALGAGMAVAVVVAWLLRRFTSVGLALSLARVDPLATAALGWSSRRLAAVRWATAGLLALGVGAAAAPARPDPGAWALALSLFAAVVIAGRQRRRSRRRRQSGERRAWASLGLGPWRAAMRPAIRVRDAKKLATAPLAPVRVTPGRLGVHMLQVRDGGAVLLDGVGLEVGPGEVVGLAGPNGAGKSTVLDAISGFVGASGGEITLEGRGVGGRRPHQRARAGLARTFQDLYLFSDRTVLENVAAGIRRRATPDTAVAAIHALEIAADLPQRVADLPISRRRLVAVARAVATRPSVLLLDEPAAGLSDDDRHRLGRLLRRLASDHGVGVLVVEHDLGFVLDVCDRAVVLDRGRVVAQGTPGDVAVDPAVVAAYLGSTVDEWAADAEDAA